jgi:2,3-bisphosphoglycerate-dependent phosphoglycerate mutase
LIDLSRESGLYIDNVLDTSAQLRAWETGDIICKALAGEFGASFDIREVENLAERCLGSVANLRVSQIEEILERDPRYQRPQPGWKSRSWYRLPFQGAESLMESGIRVASHLQHCADELEVGPKRIKVIVGHGASLRHAALCLGMLKPTDIPKLSMHHAKPIFVQRQVMGQWKKLFGEWKLRASKEEIRD